MIDATSKDLDKNGEWGDIIRDALIPIHSVVLPDGKVLAFGTDGTAGDYDARFVYSLYDPMTGVLKVSAEHHGHQHLLLEHGDRPEDGQRHHHGWRQPQHRR